MDILVVKTALTQNKEQYLSSYIITSKILEVSGLVGWPEREPDMSFHQAEVIYDN